MTRTRTRLRRNPAEYRQQLGDVADVLEGALSAPRSTHSLLTLALMCDIWGPSTTDRDPADVFAIQSEIATGHCRPASGGKISAGEKLLWQATSDLVAYNLYICAAGPACF